MRHCLPAVGRRGTTAEGSCEAYQSGDSYDIMTFEEFFTKKKIDLVQLQSDNSSLYKEFQRHYARMGEKSFDHTKKFWFNKLRKQYLLIEEEPAPVSKTPSVPASTVAEAKGDTTTAPKPAGFKPRFKAAVAKPTAETEEIKPETEVPKAEPTASKPAGFKPRFKAGVTKTAAETEETKPETEVPKAEPTASKPAGFKPRFKAGVTKTATETEETKPETEAPKAEPTASKPAGFKPRFKAGVTKTQPPKEEGNSEE